jgi:pre-mRNA-splicing factor CWC22
MAAMKVEQAQTNAARSGGVYIPPAKLRAMQAQLSNDKSTTEYQRMAWEALKKSINGLVNKVNTSNIKMIVPELFAENLIRGKGLFCRSIMKAQAASLPFTPIYAAMVAVVNTKLPAVGELLVHRLISQFRKAFRRNDKAVCLSSTSFIAHLANQQCVHEILVAEILLLLLQKPTDDSVEIAVGLMREVGEHLTDMNPQIAMVCFDRFRSLLNETDLDKRVQYMVEVLFQIRKDKWKNHPAVKDELDLVEEEDQITHQIHLDQEHDVQTGLNVFKHDPNYEENEEAYRKIKAEVLGEDSGSDHGSGSDASDESSEEEEEEKKTEMIDQTNADLVQLRKTIYLTIMSSADFEECAHKMMKVTIPSGLEHELPNMIIECCSQERTYLKFYGGLGERFARLNRLWQDLFSNAFDEYYNKIHRYETNKLRNIARFFGHMISTEAIPWHVMSAIKLNVDDTTSSSRIFIKILFQDLQEALGLPKLRQILEDPTLQESFEGILPRDDRAKLGFSINYFTSIGMGALTEQMRERFKNLPPPSAPALPAPAKEASDSESRSSYSSSGSSRSSSRSRSLSRSRQRRRARSHSSRRRSMSLSPSRGSSSSRSPPRRSRRPIYTPSASGSDSRSGSRSVSRPRSPPRRSRGGDSRLAPHPRRHGRRPSASVSPPPRKAGRPRSESMSRSRSPPRRVRGGGKKPASRSPSRSPPPRRNEKRRDSMSVSRSPPHRKR